MMQTDKRSNRWLMNGTVLYLLSPVFVAMIGRMLLAFPPPWQSEMPWHYSLVMSGVWGLLGTSIWLILRRSWVVRGIVLCSIAAGVAVAYVPGMPKQTSLEIGYQSPTYGMDVYCNDVHLGKTPVRISEQEFHERVPPWDKPPTQPRIGSTALARFPDNPTQLTTWTQLSYTPWDVSSFERDTYRRFSMAQDDFAAEARESQYWWHFDAAGHAGVAATANFHQGSHGDSRVRVVELSPYVDFLALPTHTDLMLHILRHTDGVPTQAWLDHVRRYADLLIPELHEEGAHDPSLLAALEMAAKKEFGLGNDVSADDVERVLNRILERVGRQGAFVVPSLESIALESLGLRAGPAVAKRYAALAHLDNAWASVGHGNRTASVGNGIVVRYAALQHMIRHTQPPDAFNRLVYGLRMPDDQLGFLSMSGDQRLELIAAYDQYESSRLVSRYFEQISARRGVWRDHDIRYAIRLAGNIRQPRLERVLNQFVGQHIATISPPVLHGFIGLRLDVPISDATWLIDHIVRESARWSVDLRGGPLGSNPTTLLRVHSEQVHPVVNRLQREGQLTSEDIVRSLTDHPNPYLDGLLIEVYEQEAHSDRPAVTPSALAHAMLLSEREGIRAYLRGLWQDSDTTRQFLRAGADLVEVGDVRLLHWLPLLAEASHPSERLSAIPILSRIDTPESIAILKQWAAKGTGDVSYPAQQHLDQFQQRQIQAAQLLAGQVHPDDLLPPATPYVWNAEQQEYVRVTGVN